MSYYFSLYIYFAFYAVIKWEAELITIIGHVNFQITNFLVFPVGNKVIIYLFHYLNCLGEVKLFIKSFTFTTEYTA